MSETMKCRRVLLTALAAVAIAAPMRPAHAEDAADFFKGRTLTMMVGSSTGGGYDLYARVVAEHLRKHIPGDPTIVVAVELGGAISDPSPARVRIVPSRGQSSLPLQLRPGRNGIHVALASTRALTAGDYVVEMTYPPAALSAVFPFMRRRITREISFVVVD